MRSEQPAPVTDQPVRLRLARALAGGHYSPLQVALLEWYAQQGRDLPWRQTTDPYAILVSEIMLQQTQAGRVVPKFLEFLSAYPSFQALARATRAEVIRAWAPLGYNRRAVRLHELAQRVVKEFGGALPSGPEQLRQFAGLGAYTAAAVACFAFGHQVAALDTNVRRVIGRLSVGGGDAPPSTSDLRRAAAELLPLGRAEDWNQALMDLGATVCTIRAPNCEDCPVATWCAAGPSLGARRPHRRAAELRPAYRVDRYAGSSRYFRGRVVEYLRGLPAGQKAPLDVVGAAVRTDYGPAHRVWLERLLDGLEGDGLVSQSPGPGQGGGPGERSVSLP